MYLAIRGDNEVRTTIDIDDKLMKAVLKATGLKTKREAVDLALRTLLRLKAQENTCQLDSIKGQALSSTAPKV
jgi:Arc/MetJ family transcription regulator